VFWMRGERVGRVEMSRLVRLLIWRLEKEGKIDWWIFPDEFDYREMNGIEANCQRTQRPVDPGNYHYQRKMYQQRWKRTRASRPLLLTDYSM